ncbi:MAG: SBBP repeat-containing protein [Chlorobiaceae bacterium]
MKTVFVKIVSRKKISVLIFFALFFAVQMFVAEVNAAAPPSDTNAIPAVAEKALSGTSLPFVANEGQIGNDTVKYYANTFAGNVFVMDSGLRYSIRKIAQTAKQNASEGESSSIATNRAKVSADISKGVAFDERFVDQNGDPITFSPQGEDESDIPVSYFQGSDPASWKRNVRNYGSLSLGELWQGIDVSLRARGKNIEKIFTVQPGADPADIVVGYKGIDSLSLQVDGTLRIVTTLGDVSMTAPVAYQINDDGSKRMVPVSYDVRDDNRYGFSVGDYDHERPLVIDPLLAGTFVGSGGEELYSIAVDTNGDVFVVGTTDASDFPVTVGAYQPTFGGGHDNFYISKFDSDFTQLLASTYLGGSGSSYYNTQIKLDSNHNVYLAASYSATETDYPTTAGAYQRTCTIGSYQYCGVISKLNNNLTSLLASTYVGNNDSYGNGMAIDSNGKIYLVGTTRDAAFPTTAGAYNRDYTAETSFSETFVSRFDADLTTLEASTFVGAGNAFSLKIDSNDNVFILGADASHLYPTTDGAYDTSNPLDSKFFISKLSNDLTQLIASTFLGGSNMYSYVANPNSMQLDASGNVYITESTEAADFPTTAGAYQPTKNPGGGVNADDLFVSKMSNDLTSLLASTYLGGSAYDESEGALAIDADGNVFTTSYSESQDFPTTPGAYMSTFPSDTWSYVTVSKLSSDLHSLLASTYLMASSDNIVCPYALAVDSADDVYVGGTASTGDFPTTPGAYQNSLVGNQNGAIVKLDNNLGGTPVITVPVITTDAATALTSTSATLHATLTSDGGETPSNVELKWGTQSNNYTNTCTPVTNVGSAYSCDLSGLTADTPYYVQASATNSVGTGNGSEMSFQTTATSPVITVPVITTDAATALTSTSATLHATLTSDGGETPSSVELKWGTQSGIYPNTCTPVIKVGNAYSCSLTGLAPSTTYYIQASATNSAGTGSGGEMNFQTIASDVVITPPTPPITNISSGSDVQPLNITDKECKLKKLSAKVLPNGKIKIKWKKPCSVIDTIQIERKAGDGTFKKIGSVKKDTLSYLDNGSMLPNGKYTYRIRGHRKSSGKNSDYSNKASVTIDNPTTPTTAPANIDSQPTDTTNETTNTNPPNPLTPEPPIQPTPDLSNLPTNPTPSNSSDSVILQTTKKAVQKATTKLTNLVFPGLVAGADTTSSLPLVASGMATLAFAGLAAGATMAASSTAIPLFGTSASPLGEAASRLFGIIGFVGKKKREDDWGIVFDSQTKQPLRGVAISILNEEGHVVDVCVTDSQGRYGFLPKPGNYTLDILKKDYNFEKPIQSEDILYGQLYDGQAIKIEGNEMKQLNIALTTTAIDWQDFARRKITSYTSVFSVVKRDLFLILFYAGFVTNAGIVYLFPTTLNIIFLIAYLGMVVRYIFFKKKAYGLITNIQTRQPVPFAMLSIYDAMNPQRRVAFAVSDVLGRYFMFAKNGNYLLKTSGNFLGGAHFEKMVRIEIKDGVVRSDVEV